MITNKLGPTPIKLVAFKLSKSTCDRFTISKIELAIIKI
jgi:hypothetical protein